MKDEKDFDKPLNKWIYEPRDVDTLQYNNNSQSFKKSKKTVWSKVKYIKSIPKNYRCSSKHHVYRMIDKSAWIVQCNKCGFSRQVFPGKFQLTKQGRLINLSTGQYV